MLRLNMRTTNFALNMRTDPGKADPNMPEPTGKGEYIAPQNNQKVVPVEVKIDSTASRQTVGIYTQTAFSEKMAARGQQQLSEGIARRMREGRQVRNNGPLTNAIVSISRSNMMPRQAELTIVSMPAPKITVTPSRIEGTIDPGVSKIVITPGKYTLQYSPAKVDISVDRYASIKMWTTGNYDIYA